MFAGGFAFDEGDVSFGEDDESVWHPGGSWGDEFVALASRCCDGSCECLFDVLFSHGCLVSACCGGGVFGREVEQLL